jgi:uncharacterized protein YjbI with pentapeptide repeats
MARSRPIPTEIGATQPPDLVLEELPHVELDVLEPEFELEGVRLETAVFAAANSGSGRFEQAHLQDVSFDDAKLRALELVDVRAERVSATNGDWGAALLRRVYFHEARLTGLDLGEARIEEAHFKSCKLDYANFRHSTIEFATFEDCVLANADFQGAHIYAARFEGCQLAAADFTKAVLAHVDLRGSELALAGSVLGLRGAIVDPLQLMELSPLIAHELGIVVEDA